MVESLISIITPCYNSSKYISQMIESVIVQTYPNWELLITDDCSTDNSREIVKEYCKKDPRIHLFQLDINSGAGVARNNSIEKAQGRYIAFCDSDDLWKPRKLEVQLAFMKEHGYEFTYCKSDVVDTEGNITEINERVPKVSYRSTKIINYIGTTNAMYDTSRIGKVYMRDVRKRQDWIHWIDILEKTKYAYCVPERLTSWRTGDENSLSSNKKSLFKYHLMVYEILGYSKPKAFFMCYFVSLPCFLYKKIRHKTINYLYRKGLYKAK